MARVLLVHIRKHTPEIRMPHLGLASLAAVLKQAGHDPVVFDEVLYDLGKAPHLTEVIAQTTPDVIGFTAYTATLDRLQGLLTQVRDQTALPTLVGGPHATLFTDDMVARGNFDTLVRGEAEGVIVGLVERARRLPTPEVVPTEPPVAADLPWPLYSACLRYESMTAYPIMTSRGCPYQCSFCGVHVVSSYQWRPRTPQDCAAELQANVPRLPQLQAVRVNDDCPTAQPERFKAFLRLLVEAKLGLPLGVDNLRADLMDAAMVDLLKAAGSGMLCFGVESGNPEVFGLVNKGETHEDIRRAARWCQEAGLQLALCFVIGLPGDTPERHQDSIRFARELGPTLIYWNLAHPFPGTQIHRWFVDHGADLDEPRAYTSYDAHTLVCPEPTVSTPEFTKWQRQRAYFQAVVETDQYSFNRYAPWHLLSGGVRYGLLGSAARSFGRRLGRLLRHGRKAGL
jgi:anaerobic magnesium-protoporphyrin IX monomethyl ester cyclase